MRHCGEETNHTQKKARAASMSIRGTDTSGRKSGRTTATSTMRAIQGGIIIIIVGGRSGDGHGRRPLCGGHSPRSAHGPQRSRTQAALPHTPPHCGQQHWKPQEHVLRRAPLSVYSFVAHPRSLAARSPLRRLPAVRLSACHALSDRPRMLTAHQARGGGGSACHQRSGCLSACMFQM
jgi:hypothetical protein